MGENGVVREKNTYYQMVSVMTDGRVVVGVLACLSSDHDSGRGKIIRLVHWLVPSLEALHLQTRIYDALSHTSRKRW